MSAISSHRLQTVSLVLNHLVVVGRAARDQPPEVIELSGDVSGATELYARCGFPVEAGAGEPQPFGFIAVGQLDFETSRRLAGTRARQGVVLRSGGRPVCAGELAITSFDEAGLGALRPQLKALCDGAMRVEPDFFAILSSLLDGPQETIICGLDRHLVAPGRGFVAAGWAEGLAGWDVWLIADSCRLVIDPGAIFVAAENGRPAPAGAAPSHRFACMQAVDGSLHDLRLAALSGPRVRWSPRFVLDARDGPLQLLHEIARLIPAGDLLSRPAAAESLERLAAGIIGPQAQVPVATDPGAFATVELGSPDLLPQTLKRCAIHMHIFYPDLVDEMFAVLGRPFLAAIDTYVTVTDHTTMRRVEGAIRAARRPNILCSMVPNAGRDLAPLFVGQRDLFSSYAYICHLHAKKSRHLPFGDAWRRYLVDACVGDADRLNALIGYFEAHPKMAILFPETFGPVKAHTLFESNAALIRSTLKAIRSDWDYRRLDYPAGSMCWMRAEPYRSVLDRMPDLAGFGAEDGRTDGAVAHAMERCLTLIPNWLGYQHGSFHSGAIAR